MKIHFGRHQVNCEKSFSFSFQRKQIVFETLGKGFWVGLILLATGFVGILASRERTPAAFAGFLVLTFVSTVLSFYMLITCIIPIYNDTTHLNGSRPKWQTVELTINSLLIAAGGFAVILGSIASCIGCCFVGWCTNQRDDPRYSDEPNRILIVTPNSFRFGNSSALRFASQPRVRMPRPI